MTWIDATTQLPERDPERAVMSIPVLVCCHPPKQQQLYMTVARYNLHNERWEDRDLEEVLHVISWMQLPDSPAQEGKTLFGLPVREVDDLPMPDVKFGPSPLSEAYPFWLIYQAARKL